MGPGEALILVSYFSSFRNADLCMSSALSDSSVSRVSACGTHLGSSLKCMFPGPWVPIS